MRLVQHSPIFTRDWGDCRTQQKHLSQPPVCHWVFRSTCAIPTNQPHQQLVSPSALVFKLWPLTDSGPDHPLCHARPSSGVSLLVCPWASLPVPDLRSGCFPESLPAFFSVPNHELLECLPVAESACQTCLPCSSPAKLTCFRVRQRDCLFNPVFSCEFCAALVLPWTLTASASVPAKNQVPALLFNA